MTATLYRNGVVAAVDAPRAEALLVADSAIVWLGTDEEASTLIDQAQEVVDLDGALVTAGFVDAHVHVLETGFALTGLDLSGVPTLEAALDALAKAAAGSELVLAHGWDETRWPEGRGPTRAELDRASAGGQVYAARADLHSAVISTSLAERAGCKGARGWREDGLVTAEAHHRARLAARDVAPGRRESLYRSALESMAARGVVSVHEQSAPYVDTRGGLAALLALTADPASGLPGVVGYRAEPCETVNDARALQSEIPGLTGVGGDLNVDGSIGSRTAALREPYSDGPGRGALQLTAEQIANHVTATTSAGVQAAFHAIGDAAIDELILGFQTACEVEGMAAVRAAGHRLEHGEMLDAHATACILLFGITVSAQPAFDATWGGPGGMYSQRLGWSRAALLNPLADLLGLGVPVAFGSDSPVTPVDPWASVRAAVVHHEPSQRIPVAAALRAHTRGGWQAAGLGQDGAGEIRVGAPASIALWQVPSFAPDAGAAGQEPVTPPLPDLHDAAASPRCLRTLRDGVVIHDAIG